MNGDLIRRGRRVSFTFREAKFPDGIPPPPLTSTSMTTPASSAPSSYSSSSSAADDDEVKAKKTLEAYRSGAMDGKGLLSSKIEEEHVFKVYDEIAQHWHHTRGKRKVRLHLVAIFVYSHYNMCMCCGRIIATYVRVPMSIYICRNVNWTVNLHNMFKALDIMCVA